MKPPWHRAGWRAPKQTRITGKETGVCLVGFHPGYRDRVPWGDPAWELWGFNGLYRNVSVSYFTRWFELHAPGRGERLRGWREPQDELEAIAFKTVLYTVGGDSDVMGSARYPLAEVARLAPHGAYHAGSFDYMVALALYLNASGQTHFTELRVCGLSFIEPSGEPLSARPCLEYWLGIAEGRGLKVSVESGDLFRIFHLVRSDRQYGFDPFRLVVDEPRRKR